MERRRRELRTHASRMEIIVRLALSPEGRHAVSPRVGGIGLPALATLGAAIEAANASPLFSRATHTGERIGRAAFRKRAGNGLSQGRLVAAIAVAAAAAVTAAGRRRRGDVPS
jgi:hypothetical protein